jgi:hypothetical protein
MKKALIVYLYPLITMDSARPCLRVPERVNVNDNGSMTRLSQPIRRSGQT